MFPSDVSARHDEMVGLVETTLKLHKDLPKAKTPPGEPGASTGFRPRI